MDKNNLPVNLEAEQAVLAAILLNNRAYERVSDFLRPEHFSSVPHSEIFLIIEKQISKGFPADTVTIKNYLEQKGVLADIGGTEYLDQLVQMGSTVLNIEHYARIVFDNALRRQLIDIGQGVMNTAAVEDPELPATAQIELAEQKLFELATTGTTSERQSMTIGQALRESLEQTEAALKQDGHLSGLTTGFTDIDHQIGGLHPSDLVIIAGRPGMGKTTIAMNMAFNAALAVSDNKVPKKLSGVVVFFSLEMSSAQLAARVLSSVSDIPSSSMRNGTLSDTDLMMLAGQSKEIEKLPLVLDDTPGISVPVIRARARRLQRQYEKSHGGVALIVIDYIQLLSAPGGGRKSDNRVQELSEMTRGLKMLAKELNVPVLALSQLSRTVESRDDKRPILSDLRESGSIEQDADIVAFTYRHEYYLQGRDPANKLNQKGGEKSKNQHDWWQKDMEKYKNKAELIIAKQRHGPIGTIHLGYRGEYSRFTDLDPQAGRYEEDNYNPAGTHMEKTPEESSGEFE
ncbi:MAG: replicative DNA helicase [Rickettsiales bacterium]|jgi:replicative DNA helicase|nr:replicative DNA helicase [Rickettsiales bacterium]